MKASESVFKNFNEILATLSQVHARSELNFIGEDIALAAGLLATMKKLQFVFMLNCMRDLLAAIEPANQILQKQDVGYRIAMPVITATVERLEEFRTEEKFQEYYSAAVAMLEPNRQAGNMGQATPRRARRRSTLLGDYVVEETLGERNEEKIEIKSAFFAIIDNMLSEIKTRFVENNSILLALSSTNEMKLDSLKELVQLGVEMPSDAEFSVAKKYLDSRKEALNTENFNFAQLKHWEAVQLCAKCRSRA